MIGFNFEKFGREKRISKLMLTDAVSLRYPAVTLMWKRGTIKEEILTELEVKYGKLSRYIKTN